MSKHIDTLHVQNFRCLKDFKIENLGDVNLLVGKNNSGKSTVLDALRVYTHPFPIIILQAISIELYEIIKEDIGVEFVKNFFSYSEKNKNHFTICHDKGQSLKVISGFIEVEEKKVSDNAYQVSQKFIVNTSEIDITKKNAPAIQILYNEAMNFETNSLSENGKAVIVQKTKNPNYLDWYYVPSQRKSDLQGMTELSSWWDRIIQQHPKKYREYQDEIITILKSLDSSIEDWNFLGWKFDNRFRNIFLTVNNHEQTIPVKSMGDGVATVLNILIALYNCKDGVLLIDEFENGLHFSVQKKLWEVIFKIAKDLNIQVFATTHSLDTVKSFSEVAVENNEMDGALFRIGKSRISGEVMASFYNEDELNDDIKREHEVR